jgi:hypothetical protein
VLIYSIDSTVRYDRHVFGKDRAKTYFSIQAMLLHVRTGIVPWTTLVDQELEVAEGEALDRDIFEQSRLNAIDIGLAKIGDEMNTFLNGMP